MVNVPLNRTCHLAGRSYACYVSTDHATCWVSPSHPPCNRSLGPTGCSQCPLGRCVCTGSCRAAQQRQRQREIRCAKHLSARRSRSACRQCMTRCGKKPQKRSLALMSW